MENKYKVGDRLDWGNATPDDYLTITKIKNGRIYFICDDGYKSDASIVESNNWTLLKDKVADNVVNPAHYTTTKISALDVIDDWSLNFYLGNVIKYIKRYKLKGKPQEDLEKASTYLNFAIQRLKDEQDGKKNNN